MFLSRTSWVTRTRLLFRRIFRADPSAHAAALGVAIGLYVSCLPIVGQTVLAFIIALFVRANKAVAALMANWHVPFLFFLLHWAWQAQIGMWLMGEPMSFDKAYAIIRRIDFSGVSAFLRSTLTLKDAFVACVFGGQIVGIPASILAYFLIRRAATAFHDRRHANRARLAILRHRRKAEEKPL